MILADVLAVDQQLVDADRAVGLAATAEQAAEREVQLDGLRIDAHRPTKASIALSGCSLSRKLSPLR